MAQPQQLQPLGQFLMGGPPTQSIDHRTSDTSTTSKTGSYSADDIIEVHRWDSFNYHAIQTQFGPLLQDVRMVLDPFTTSPPPTITSEKQVTFNAIEHFSRPLRRSLRATFAHLERSRSRGWEPVQFHSGDIVRLEKKVPDFGFMNPGLSISRLPGDAKASTVFRHVWKDFDVRSRVNYMFRQALSQVNFYMKTAGARYGFIITEHELVAIRRTATPGHLEVSDPIPYDANGSRDPQLTVLMALWYLGMLAAGNSWNFPQPGPAGPAGPARRP